MSKLSFQDIRGNVVDTIKCVWLGWGRDFVMTDGHRYRNGGIIRISSGPASVVGFSLNRLVITY